LERWRRWVSSPKANVRLTTALLGGVLVVYALIGLIGVHFKVSPERSPARAADRSNNPTHERRDGNFRRPQRAVRASAQPRQGRVGASVGNLGFVSTLAVTLGLSLNNGLGGALVVPAMIALVGAFVGVAIGKALPSRLSVAVFRRWVPVGLLLLGCSMVARFVL